MKSSIQWKSHSCRCNIVAWIVLSLCILVSNSNLLAQSDGGDKRWVATWGTGLIECQEVTLPRISSQQNPPRAWQPITTRNPDVHFSDQTIRQVLRTSIGGEQVRVVLSNLFETEPLEVGAVSLAFWPEGTVVGQSSVRRLTFGGYLVTDVLPGAVAVSDPVTLKVPAVADLAIDIYLPGSTSETMSPVTTPSRSLHTNYVSPSGNHSGATEMPA